MMRLNKIQYFIDSFGLIAIGMFSIGYIYYSVRFAELHIQFPFLDFPVFIGEILLIICFALFCLKYVISPFRLNKWHYIVILYFAFVVTKALIGYNAWGPLAFRNAALLYYPMFAVLGYFFYRKDFFKGEHIFFLLAAAIMLTVHIIHIIGETKVVYWSFSITLLALAFTNCYTNKKIRYLLIALVLLCAPYKYMFLTSRMMIVSNLIAALYLIAAFFIILKSNIRVKILLAVLCIALLALGIFKFSNPVRVRSIVAFKEIAEVFNDYDRRVQAKIDYFEMGEIKDIKVYQPEGVQSTFEMSFSEFKARQDAILAKNKKEQKIVNTGQQQYPAGQNGQIKKVAAIGEGIDEALVAGEAMENKVIIKKTIEEMKMEGYVGEANLEELAIAALEGKYVDKYYLRSGLNNAVFRLLIWRDMIVELYQKKPVVGFDFGKPVRSISLEILHWGWHNWGLNGWMPVHNSLLHIIYRTGVMGILFITSILVILFRMIKFFILKESVVGVLLCGVFINWFVASNFLLILELPYTAIPVWAIFGITLAYYHEQKRVSYGLEQ